MKEERWILWVALVGISLAAAMLHIRIHPPSKGLTYVWPTLFASLDLVLVSLFFLSRRTAVWGLLLNSFIAYLGIIMMSDFSLTLTLTGVAKVKPSDGLIPWFLTTTFPDSAIVLGDFLVGQALYRSIMRQSARQAEASA